MTRWDELARRWTPKCQECKEPLDCRTAQFSASTCDNPDCPANPDKEKDRCENRK